MNRYRVIETSSGCFSVYRRDHFLCFYYWTYIGFALTDWAADEAITNDARIGKHGVVVKERWA